MLIVIAWPAYFLYVTIRPMTTLSDRVKELLSENPALTMREVDRRIGQYSGVTTRIVKGERTKLHPETMTRLANAFGVSLDWLITGRGPKRPDYIRTEYDPLYPNRAKAIEIAREDGFSEKAIQRVKAAKLKEGVSDLRVTNWLIYIKEEDEKEILSLP